MYRYKQKRARKKREAETSLYSLALYNAQRSYSTKLSLGTLSISHRDFHFITGCNTCRIQRDEESWKARCTQRACS